MRPSPLLAVLCFVAASASAVQPPRVPSDLQADAAAIDMAEIILQRSAPAPLRVEKPTATAIKHFVSDHLDFTRRGPTEKNPELARMMRLIVGANDDEGGPKLRVTLGELLRARRES